MRRSTAPSKKRAHGPDISDMSETGSAWSGEEPLSQAGTKQFNEAAMADSTVVVHRAPVLRFLAVPKETLRKPFQLPISQGWVMPVKERGLGRAVSGRRSLGMTRNRAPPAMPSKFKPLSVNNEEGGDAAIADVEDDLYKKYMLDLLVLYENPADGHKITVEPVIGKYLREHQRVGMQFLLECIGGLRDYGGEGCILADDMYVAHCFSLTLFPLVSLVSSSSR